MSIIRTHFSSMTERFETKNSAEATMENHWVKASSRVYARASARVHACTRVLTRLVSGVQTRGIRTACLMTLVPLSGAEKPTGSSVAQDVTQVNTL